MIRRAALLMALLGLAASPASAEPQLDFSIPPYAGAYQPQGKDEQGLWMQLDEWERDLRDSPLVIRDAALNTYVRGVLCRTVGQDRCGSTRIYIVRDHSFNASIGPNGMMLVHSGLLLRAKNEAELASVLGHEFGHFELRHSLQRFKRQRSATDFLAWSQVAAGMMQQRGQSTQGIATAQRSVVGALFEHSRDDETAADVLGFAYIRKARYRPAAAADVWRSMMDEADRSARARDQRSTRFRDVPFFATHPTNLQRADTLSLLANRVSGGDFDGEDVYSVALAPWRARFLDDEIKRNDFGASEHVLERLAGELWTAELQFARAELYRLRGNPRDLVNAAKFYREALAQQPGMSEARRGLALSLLRSGNTDEGRSALGEYLSARPDAPDAKSLRALIAE